MASTFAVTRKHLIFGICLPLALLLGYLLADAQDPVSILIVACAIIGLTIPLLMKWYHPLLVLAWNMNAMLALPGRPTLWAIMAFVGLLVVVLNRSVTDEEGRFSPVPTLTYPLLAFAFVVVVTAAATGGINLGVLRSGAMGGKNYFYLLAAIAGFFVLSSKSIPPGRAGFYAALFFLPGIMAAAGRVAAWIGPAADFVYLMFPPDFDMQSAEVAGLSMSAARLGGVAIAASLVFFWLLARVGAGGVFDLGRPWRLGLFLGLFFASTLGGYRSIAIYMLLTFTALFFLEKLWRTRAMFILLAGLIVGGSLLAAFATKLPFTVQRTLSFLPIKVDPAVRVSADNSSTWRVEMWQEAVKRVPTYLFRGKGYSLSADEMYMAAVAVYSGHTDSWAGSLAAGDYHNGPLSLLITFGIYGFVTFAWLIIAGIRYLYSAYQNSPPELRQINALLLACFAARAVFFFLVYGAIAQDLAIFTGLLGLSVALNVPHLTKATEPAAPDQDAVPQV